MSKQIHLTYDEWKRLGFQVQKGAKSERWRRPSGSLSTVDSSYSSVESYPVFHEGQVRRIRGWPCVIPFGEGDRRIYTDVSDVGDTAMYVRNIHVPKRKWNSKPDSDPDTDDEGLNYDDYFGDIGE